MMSSMAPALIAAAGPIKRLLADKAYDTNSLRQLSPTTAPRPSSPPPPAASQLIPYDAKAYRQRNLIERMFARLKDFRRIATRYDKLARNFLAGAIIAATVTLVAQLSPDPSTCASRPGISRFALFSSFWFLCDFVRRRRERMLICYPNYRSLKNICDCPGIREADNCRARSSRLECGSANDKVLF